MNAVIYKNNSDKIKYVITDCIRSGNNYVGTNRKVFGIKPRHYSVVWTVDDIQPIFVDGEIVGYDKNVSDLNIIDDEISRDKPTHMEHIEAIKIRRLIDTMSYQEVEDYINTNVTDLPSARTYIIRLSKVVLALVKIVDKEG
jgi:hypothetical protein